MILAAKERGEMRRTIILAHQIEAMSIEAVTKKGRTLKPVDHYLKPLLEPRTRRRRRSLDQGFERVAAWLDRKAARPDGDDPRNPAAAAADEPKED